ncbi:methyltransferase [soil metagenome]
MTDATLGPEVVDITVEAFIGGWVEAVQAGRGHHRAGLEAVLLGAALGADFSGALVDLGAGSGVAGLVAAARCANARVALVDRDETAIACARAALLRPANRIFAGRVTVIDADIASGEAARIAAGLGPASADAIVTNPPFNFATRGTVSPGAARASAHTLEAGGLDLWLRAAASLLKPTGELVIVFRASGLGEILSAAANRLGALDILPIHPRRDEPAHRVLVRGIKGSRGQSRLLPPLVLHGDTGNAYMPAVERMLRDGAGLAEIHPPWTRE